MIELPEAVTLATQLHETVKGSRVATVVASHSPHKWALVPRRPRYLRGPRSLVLGSGRHRKCLLPTGTREAFAPVGRLRRIILRRSNRLRGTAAQERKGTARHRAEDPGFGQRRAAGHPFRLRHPP